MLDFLYLLRKASCNLLIIPIQRAATNSTDGEDGKAFCESHVDTAVSLNQTLLTEWWMERPWPRILL